jgi:hypothetical protein
MKNRAPVMYLKKCFHREDAEKTNKESPQRREDRKDKILIKPIQTCSAMIRFLLALRPLRLCG